MIYKLVFGLWAGCILSLPAQVYSQTQPQRLNACFNEDIPQIRLLNKGESGRFCGRSQRFITWTAATQQFNPGNIVTSIDCTVMTGSVSGVLVYYMNNPAHIRVDVKGMCAESVTIPRNNVHLYSNNAYSPNGINVGESSGIYINGKTGIIIEGLKVQSDSLFGDGMAITGNSSVQLNQVHITGFNNGIRISQGAQVEISDSNIASNRYGVDVSMNSGVLISGSEIVNHIIDGIRSYQNAVVALTNSEISGNNSNGISLEAGAMADISGNTITNNGGSGVVMNIITGLHVVSTNITNNAGFGINCFGSVSLSLGLVPDTNSIINNNLGSFSENCP